MISPLILPAGAVLADHVEGWQRIANPNAPPASQTFRHALRLLVAIRSKDLDGRWHLSVSHRDRIPTWGELGFARDCLLPADAWMCIGHPPRKYWVNYDRRVLHLWEVRDDTLITAWRQEGEFAQRAGYGRPDDGEARR